MKPVWITDKEGAMVNLNTVNRLRVSGRTFLAELPNRTITIKKCESVEEAEEEMKRVSELGGETTAVTADPGNTVEIVDIYPSNKPATRRRTKKK